MSKMSKIQYMECNALIGMHVEDIEDIKNTCILVVLAFYTDLWMCLSETNFSRALHILENNSTL